MLIDKPNKFRGVLASFLFLFAATFVFLMFMSPNPRSPWYERIFVEQISAVTTIGLFFYALWNFTGSKSLKEYAQKYHGRILGTFFIGVALLLVARWLFG